MLFGLLKLCLPEDNFVDKRIALDADGIKKPRIDAVYAVLSVLDTKASALMRLDGVLLAAAFVGVQADLYSADSWSFAIITLASVISMMLCLMVVSVDWSFLGKTTVTPATTAAAATYDFSDELKCLIQVRLLRERAYRCAWSFAFLASVIFGLVLAMRFWPPSVLLDMQFR